MKKVTVILLLVVMCFFVSGCGNSKVIEGKKYHTYGFINKTEMRHSNIEYDLIVGNVVWSVLLCNTIVAPIYFLGFSMYEPVATCKSIDKL